MCGIGALDDEDELADDVEDVRAGGDGGEEGRSTSADTPLGRSKLNGHTRKVHFPIHISIDPPAHSWTPADMVHTKAKNATKSFTRWHSASSRQNTPADVPSRFADCCPAGATLFPYFSRRIRVYPNLNFHMLPSGFSPPSSVSRRALRLDLSSSGGDERHPF